MKIILPVAGDSSRYPGVKPKWLLTHPNGNLMFHEALRGLDLAGVNEVVIVCRRDHVEDYAADEGVRRQFEVSDLNVPYRLSVIEPTRSQPETVAEGLRQENIVGPFFIKDSDNFFKCKVTPGNSIAVLNLRDAGVIDASNKSYVELDAHERAVNIVEKHVISNTICVGGYGFADATSYVEAFDTIKHHQGLYVSHVIYEMISRGAVFQTTPVSGYCDWGTQKDWDRFKRKFATLFVDLDGTIVKSSGQFFEPGWGSTDAIEGTVAALNRLRDSGCIQLILTTSRPESRSKDTESQLERIGLGFDRIIYGLSHSRRIVINDYATTNPYKSADAINVPRDSDELAGMLRDFFEDLF